MKVKKPLRILHIQPFNCARAIKQAYALKSLKHGHQVICAAFEIARDRYIAWGDDAYDLSIRIGSPKQEQGTTCTNAVL
ncbi:MAG: hypothetical protein ACXQTL_06100, partial [Methanosarcinales archaeon]